MLLTIMMLLLLQLVTQGLHQRLMEDDVCFLMFLVSLLLAASVVGKDSLVQAMVILEEDRAEPGKTCWSWSKKIPWYISNLCKDLIVQGQTVVPSCLLHMRHLMKPGRIRL